MSDAVESPADRGLLRRLLHDWNERPEDRVRVEAEIGRRFQHRLAIMVLDATGFTHAVRARGIINLLALLERMERLVTPVVERAGGRILRREADNIFAVFSDPGSAVAAAASIVAELGTVNEALPEDDELSASIGIGYGDLLLVGTDDLWGDEMNLASKLGEDLAERGAILLSQAAHAALEDGGRSFEEIELSVSGIPLTAFRLVTEG